MAIRIRQIQIPWSLTLFLLLTPIARGAETSPRKLDDARVEVIIRDPRVPKSAFDQPGIHARYGEAEDATSLPGMAAVNDLLSQAGLGNLVAYWDQLDRDMLVLTVREHGLSAAQASYPKLPPENLRKLATLLAR